MEDEYMTAVVDTEDSLTTKGFKFSSPNIVYSPEKVINFGSSSEHVFSPTESQGTIFQFSPPTNLSKGRDEISPECRHLAKQYKPRISRNSFKPSINMFSQALKGTI